MEPGYTYSLQAHADGSGQMTLVRIDADGNKHTAEVGVLAWKPIVGDADC